MLSLGNIYKLHFIYYWLLLATISLTIIQSAEESTSEENNQIGCEQQHKILSNEVKHSVTNSTILRSASKISITVPPDKDASIDEALLRNTKTVSEKEEAADGVSKSEIGKTKSKYRSTELKGTDYSKFTWKLSIGQRRCTESCTFYSSKICNCHDGEMKFRLSLNCINDVLLQSLWKRYNWLIIWLSCTFYRYK